MNCSGQVFCIAGTGTLAMEMAIANVTKRGDQVLLVSHFWDQAEICERKELKLDVLRSEWGKIIPVDESAPSSMAAAYACAPRLPWIRPRARSSRKNWAN